MIGPLNLLPGPRLGRAALAVLLVTALAGRVQADPLLWNVTTSESVGPPFPASTSVHLDIGVLYTPPPPPGGDSIPFFARTHAADVTLQNFTSALTPSVVRMVGADSAGEFGPGSSASLDLRVGHVAPEITPVPINWQVKFDFRPDVGGTLGGHINPDFLPIVTFTDTSFSVAYSLDLTGHTNPELLPIQQHTLAGTVPINWQSVYRISDVQAVIGSLDLSITLTPLGTTPVSGAESTILSMTLTGSSAAAVPEPASVALLLTGVAVLAVRRWRRRGVTGP